MAQCRRPITRRFDLGRKVEIVLANLEDVVDLDLHLAVDTSPAVESVESGMLMPFFADCVGAIDGTHIPVTVDAGESFKPWRNRKGFLSQKASAA